MDCPICYEKTDVMFECKRCKNKAICQKCFLDKCKIDKSLTISCPLCRYDDKFDETFTKIIEPGVQEMKKVKINNFMWNDNNECCVNEMCIVKKIANLPVLPPCEMPHDSNIYDVCKHKFLIYMCIVGSCINCCACVVTCPTDSVFNICRCLQF